MIEADDADDLVFAEEDEPLNSSPIQTAWKVLVVDDEEEVHRVTNMVLNSVCFDQRPVTLLHAYSAEECKVLLRTHTDIALILLDVVMETDDAGLKLVKYIRSELKNIEVRIVLRTGQPGQAPEEKVIVEYDINDYKAKTELTSSKLFTTVITSLRSYRDIQTIAHNKEGLKCVIDASPYIFKMQSMTKFTTGILEQLVSLLNLGRNSLFCCGFTATCKQGEFYVKAATGEYKSWVNYHINEIGGEDVKTLIAEALQKRTSIYRGPYYVGFLSGKTNSEFLIFINGWNTLMPWDQDLVQIFFTNVSLGYDNLLLNHEIEDTQSEVIYTLGEIAEVRSKETGFHVKRVAEYSELLALLYGIPEQEAKIYRLASPMHDIGKLGIPDAILNKPGRLNHEEWKVMQSHAQLGYDMLKNSTRALMKAAAIAAHQHHERWDGSGYPNGLKGDEIHIFGRITAIADVFDALSVRRVYKDAWPVEKVVCYFQREKGSHFEPALVDLLCGNLAKFLKIRDANTNPWERGEGTMFMP